jgi:hypothetical protein
MAGRERDTGGLLLAGRKDRMTRLVAVLGTLVACLWAAPALAQAPTVLVDDTTPGHYNAALGTALDNTQPQFPCADTVCGDPTIDPASEPDLSSVSSTLGGWLSDPVSLNSNWSTPQAIPPSWDLNTETAIIYEIDAGSCGVQDVTASFGVDNGIFVWVNGAYTFGALAPGGAVAGEYIVSLGDLRPGTNFVQILREDHGLANGFSVEITGIADCADDDDDGDDDDGDDNDDGDDDDGDSGDNGDNGHDDDDGDNGHGDDGDNGHDDDDGDDDDDNGDDGHDHDDDGDDGHDDDDDDR